MMIPIQKYTSMTRQRECSRNIIWLALVDLHHLYVWRVRILLPANLYFANFFPEEMNNSDQRCTDLIALTNNSLSGGVVTLMLVAVQKDNLEVSIKHAIKR
jgi:hypothetical protein